MKQTEVHDKHNPDLLRLIPVDAKRLIEVGCSSGALAKEFKAISPNCDYLGIEVDPTYAELARRYCNTCLTYDIESAPEEFWIKSAGADCWIFGDTLEHLRDPWSILLRIRSNIAECGKVVACIPNAQHWSLQAKLSVGDFRYEAHGLMDKTHLRWFTRQTIIEMFEQSGFQLEAGMPRIFNEPGREAFLPVIEQMAKAAGVDSAIAVNDSLPLQYVVRATTK